MRPLLYALACTLLALLSPVVALSVAAQPSDPLPLPEWTPVAGPSGGWVVALASTAGGNVAVASAPGGLFRTSTGGERWAPVERPAAPWLFAAPDGTFWTPTPALAFSTDGGQSWTPRAAGLPGGPVAALGGADGTPLYAALEGGLYRLDPGAAAWTPTGFDRAATAVAVAPDGTVYVGSEPYGDPSPFAVYRSSDGGATWTRAVLREGDLSAVTSLVVTPDGAVYAGGELRAMYQQAGLFRSADAGATWVPVAGLFGGGVEWMALVGDAVYARPNGDGPVRIVGESVAPVGEFATAAAPGPGGSVLLGTNGLGIRRGQQSEPSGGPYVDATDGLGRALVSRLAALAGGVVLASTADGIGSAPGVWRSGDGGATWTRDALPFVPDGVYGFFRSPDGALLMAPRRAFVAGIAHGSGLYRTADGGRTWQDVSTLDANGQRQPFTGLGAGTDGILWAVGGRRSFRSVDGGRTWERRADLPWTAMSFSVGPSGTLWVGEDQGGGRVLRSSDGAASWTVSLPAAGVRVPALIETRSGAVIASVLYPDYRSPDGGASWGPVDFSLPEVWNDIDDFVEVAPGVIYGAADAPPYVVRSTDDGVTWEPAGAGLPTSVEYASGFWLADDGLLWSAVPGGGVFRTAQPVTVSSETGPASAASLEVRPNPARGRAEVVLTVAEATSARVVVFDALGREVALLLDGPVGAEARRVSVDVSKLPAGVYVVRASAGTAVQTARLVVAR